jgi:hypothetical protein
MMGKGEGESSMHRASTNRKLGTEFHTPALTAAISMCSDSGELHGHT